MGPDTTTRVSRRALMRTGAGAAAAATAAGAATTARTWANATPAAAADRANGVVGAVVLDDFAGSTDDAKFAAALSYIAAQTYRPALLLTNRRYELNATYALFNDLSIYGVGMEREFAKQTLVKAGAAALFRVPTGQPSNYVKNVTIRGISFQGGAGTDFFEPVDLASGPILAYSDIRECGFNLFRRVMWSRLLGSSLDDIYVNNGTDTQLYLSGSDNFIGTGGHFFMDSQALTADKYLLRFGHMSKTDVGGLFITGTKATGIRVDGGRGLTFNGTKSEARAGSAAIATQGSALVITGGSGIVVRDCWFFNVMANPAATGNAALHKGYVTVTGGDGILVTGCRFDRGGSSQTSNTPAGTPCVYASGGRVLCRANLATSGQTLIYKASATTYIDADAGVVLG
jgi:hypothetical protein